MREGMQSFRKIIGWLSWGGNIVATSFLALVMLLMVAEIIGRYAFNRPIPGTHEIVGAAMVVLGTIGFAFALEQKRHIRATLVVSRLSPKVQEYLLVLAYFVGFVLIGILGWKLAVAAIDSVKIKEVTWGLIRVPVYPVKVVFLFAVLLFWLQFLRFFIDGLRGRNI